jgi:phage replication O-like protein O
VVESTGYTKVPNCLLDFLISAPGLGKRDLVLMLAIVRNTIGWNRPASSMSCRFLAEQTGMRHSHVSETLRSLEGRFWVVIDRSKRTAIVSLHPDLLNGTASASVVPDAEIVPKSGTILFPKQERSQNRNVPESGTKLFPKQEHYCSQNGNDIVPKTGTKERKKEIYKERKERDPPVDLDGLF